MRLRKMCFLAVGILAVTAMGSTTAKAQLYASVDELPQLDGFNIDFVQAEDRALTIEDGLEFFEALGTWGVYRVTSANPRLYMPGVVAGTYDHHSTVVCGSSAIFTDQTGFGLTRFDVRLIGVRASGEQLLGTDPRFMFTVPNCSSTGDRLGGAPGAEPIDYTYLEFDPVPPIGSLVPLRMVGVDSPGSDVPHDSAQPICCVEDDCGLNEPPGGWPPPGSICGDGIIGAAEVCDDGANNGRPGYCKTDCTGPVEPPGGGGPDCGDGNVDAGEMCDDGPNNGQAGFCKADCTGPIEPPGGGGPNCSNGNVDAGEECDDGPNNGQPGYCRVDCTYPIEPTGGSNPTSNPPGGCPASVAHNTGHAVFPALVTLLAGVALVRRRRRA